MIGVLVALAAISATAEAAQKRCFDSLNLPGETYEPTTEAEKTQLTENQCEALNSRELRLRLFEIPQESEDPMSLSVGAKNLGGVLRFKIPFSF
jgi:hypothetical protein